METMLPITKTPSASNNTFLRLIPENNNGKIGPDIATARAMRLANHLLFYTDVKVFSNVR